MTEMARERRSVRQQRLTNTPPAQMSVKNCFIRGSVVRYVQIPRTAVDTTLLEDATRRGEFGLLRKGVYADDVADRGSGWEEVDAREGERRRMYYNVIVSNDTSIKRKLCITLRYLPSIDTTIFTTGQEPTALSHTLARHSAHDLNARRLAELFARIASAISIRIMSPPSSSAPRTKHRRDQADRGPAGSLAVSNASG